MHDFKPILSVNDLSARLGIPKAQLLSLACEVESHYSTWPSTNKRTGKVRMITSPSAELKKIQGRIARAILLKIPIGKTAQGGVKGCSPRTNASLHLGQDWLVTLDVKNFYPTIRHHVVLKLFRKELGFGRDVARLLTRLTTLNAGLPQGAPTSLALANILLSGPVDTPISRHAMALELNSSRWVDDFSFSGSNPHPLINDVAKRLSARGLKMYRMTSKKGAKCKLKITPRSDRQEVTGLVVNGHRPTLSRIRRSRVKAAIFQARQLTGVARDKALRSIEGRIRHVAEFNASSAAKLKSMADELVSTR